MSDRVAEYIERNGLLRKEGGPCLVALSGGADSVALLLILQRLGYQTEAMHCNFNLRGEESRRDEQFVKELCEAHNTPLHLIHFDTREYAQLHKVSIEMAARELRYRYFEQLRADIGAQAICVAHHRNDSVETLLMNLIRGTGLKGLTGIKARNGHVVRPLLCLSRQEIEAFLESEKQPYMTDSTNLKADEATRNKIRLQVIPLLQEINPSVVHSLQQTAERLAEAEKVVDAAMPEFKSNELQLSTLRSYPSPELVLFAFLSPYGFSPAVIEQLSHHLDATPGRLYQSATHDLVIDRDCIIVEPRQEEMPTLRIPETGTYRYRQEDRFRVSLVEGSTLKRESSCACLDAGKVQFPLTIRPVQQGDRFIPFGMEGSRLVSDFMTDRKMSLLEKHRQLTVVDASGKIVWLVGLRPDNRCCLTAETKNTLMIEYQRKE